MIAMETFESGVTRETLQVRYDLCSPLVLQKILWEYEDFVKELYQPSDTRTLLNKFELVFASLTDRTDVLCEQNFASILEAYARTMSEGAAKYGERNWEKGIPEDNLRNHAIHHLVQFIGGDTSEPHLDHLIWNVLTMIHFREKQENP